jgi:hypothetical protein
VDISPECGYSNCPCEDGTPENEPCGQDPDVVNGGCNSTPYVFGSLACGETVCGTSYSSTTTRDTDWFHVALAGDTDITLTASGEFPMQLLWVSDPGMDCLDYTYVITTAGVCEDAVIAAADQPAGDYYAWIGASVFEDWPCDKEYTLTLDCGAIPDCPCEVGDPEGEGPCADEYVDAFNGGCNSTPFVWSTISCGQTICGLSGTYLFGGSSYRDTDWYQLPLTAPTTVTVDVFGNYSVLAYLLDVPLYDCTVINLVAGGPYAYCVTGTFGAAVPAGDYAVFVSVNAFAGFPCGVEYSVSVTCE